MVLFAIIGIIIILISVSGGSVPDTGILPSGSMDSAAYVPPAVQAAEIAKAKERAIVIAEITPTFTPGNIVAPLPVIEPITYIAPLSADDIARIQGTYNPDGSLIEQPPPIVESIPAAIPAVNPVPVVPVSVSNKVPMRGGYLM